MCGPNEKEIEAEIISNINKNNFTALSDKKIKDIIPYLCSSDMYVGNDSYGSHITSQSGKKSIVILLDSPKTYTDYSINYFPVIPHDNKNNDLTQGSKIDPNLVSVDKVIELIKELKA